MLDHSKYSDRVIVRGIINNDHHIIEYFFFDKCSSLLNYIVYSIFDGNINVNELISELYLYLSSNNWKKIKQFDFKSNLTTWTSVVAIRFFQKKRSELIENKSIETLKKKIGTKMVTNLAVEREWDVQKAIEKMPNARYRKVVEELDIKEMKPEKLAREMEVSVDNLYNIHRRALLQLKCVMTRMEDYYD